MNKKILIFSFVLVFSILLTGCNFPGQVEPTTQVDMLNTAAAQTIQAQQTIIAQTSQPNEPWATATSLPVITQEGVTPEATTAIPTFTAQPTATSVPVNTATPTPYVECNVAGFVSETIPDGTDFDPGESFTKTWTLKNTGSCTWNQDYDVVFYDGYAMNAPAAKQLTTGTVAPGQSITISLDLKAPLAAGRHRGDFKLRNANGVLFGIGSDHKTFWVEIDVEGTLYDFAKNYCASGAVWSSGAGTLPCPGSSGDSRGWVFRIDNPRLENLVVDDEPGLQVQPQMVNNGWIKGVYPKITVTEGVYFKAIVGCYGGTKCDVNFKLNYKVDGGTEKTLATWHEIQDGKFNKVSVDLSSLAGEDVQFILFLQANGNADNDKALWFAPRIEP